MTDFKRRKDEYYEKLVGKDFLVIAAAAESTSHDPRLLSAIKDPKDENELAYASSVLDTTEATLDLVFRIASGEEIKVSIEDSVMTRILLHMLEAYKKTEDAIAVAEKYITSLSHEDLEEYLYDVIVVATDEEQLEEIIKYIISQGYDEETIKLAAEEFKKINNKKS